MSSIQVRNIQVNEVQVLLNNFANFYRVRATKAKNFIVTFVISFNCTNLNAPCPPTLHNHGHSQCVEFAIF
jgi:hypothetical protein